jgi:glycerol uptake facilitator protein
VHPYLAEFIGTAILILLGNGVVANVVLARTKGHEGGWIVITAGWGLAVFAGVACVAESSGAHLNPAVTIGLALAGVFAWADAPAFIAAQFAGAFSGACLVFLSYYRHYAATEQPAPKLATFATGPEIRAPAWNLLTEILGTFVLVLVVLYFARSDVTVDGVKSPVGLGALGAIPVGLLVFSIGLSLGGPTGYAINPARDLAPRIAHALLPIPGKGSSDWEYAWVPVVGPILGGALAAGVKIAAGG